MLETIEKLGLGWSAVIGSALILLAKQAADPLFKWMFERLKAWAKNASDTSIAKIDDRAKFTDTLAKERAEAIERADKKDKEYDELQAKYQACELSIRDIQLKHIEAVHAQESEHAKKLAALTDTHLKEISIIEANHREAIRRLQQSIEAQSFLNAYEYIMKQSPDIIEGFARLKRKQLEEEKVGDTHAERRSSEDPPS